MIRKIKALGLALVAVFAMSAVVASAASATNGTLTTFPTTTVVATGEQVGEHVFTLTDHPIIGGGFANVKCKKATFDGVGTNKDGDTTVTVTPTYSECTAFGLAATIEHDECTYILHTGTTTGLGGWHVVTTVSCPEGKTITIKTATCEVRVGSQSLTTSEVTNSGTSAEMDLLLHTNIENIAYTVTKDGIGCPLSGTGSFSKGDYVGTTTVKAHDAVEKTPVGITLHDIIE